MKKRVLVLGSSGMLGHQVFLRLLDHDDYDVYDLSYRNKLRPETIICDVSDFISLKELISKIQPEVIINCIGILIKGSNQNPENSILINAYLPHFLVAEADQIGAKVIHISTDCVFSGKKGGYLESDFRDADDVYGRGKALGEIISDKHLTLRTSIIGPELKRNGEGLFHWFMNQSTEVNGFTHALWGGVTTTELAKIIEYSIEKDICGLRHVTNGTAISKFELLSLFNSEFETGININPVEGKKVDKSLKSEFPDLLPEVPSYTQMIRQLRLFMLNHKQLYSDIYPNVG